MKIVLLKFFLIVAATGLMGCATAVKKVDEGGTLIEASQPARIEVNGEYLGITPVRAYLPSMNTRMWNRYMALSIVAIPTVRGQNTQSKYISGNQETPSHIFFEMGLVPNPYREEIKHEVITKNGEKK